jgi:hypothetical protein
MTTLPIGAARRQALLMAKANIKLYGFKLSGHAHREQLPGFVPPTRSNVA